MSTFRKRLSLVQIKLGYLLLLSVVILNLLIAPTPAQTGSDESVDFYYEFVWVHDELRWEHSCPYAFNQNGHVLGTCRFHDADWSRAFVWKGPSSTVYLDEVPTLNTAGKLLDQFRYSDPEWEDGQSLPDNEFYYHTVQDMNDHGQIVGSGYYMGDWPDSDAVRVAFRWTPDDTWENAVLDKELFDYPDEGNFPESEAYQIQPRTINNDGDFAGTYIVKDEEGRSDWRIFLYIEGDGYTAIGHPAMERVAGTQVLSNRFVLDEGTDAPEYIQLTLSSYNYVPDAGSRAIRYTAPINDVGSGQFEDLGTLREDDSGHAGARSINDLGEIAGGASSDDGSYTNSAFRYSDTEGMVSLGSLSSGPDYRSSWAYSINNFGEVVGASHYRNQPFTYRPFFYTPQFGMLDLTQLTLYVPWESIDLSRFRPMWINDVADAAGPLQHWSHIHAEHPPKAFLLRRLEGAPPRIFASTDTPKSIADPHPQQGPRETSSTITIADTQAFIGGLEVYVGIDHSRPSDLSATLLGPGNIEQVLFGPEDYREYFNVVFAGDVALDGQWSVIVKDHVRGETGTFLEWTIKVPPIAESGEEPPGNGEEPASGVVVKKITYATSGGRNQDRHLDVSVYLEDEENPLVGAEVTVTVNLDGEPYHSTSGTTNSAGLFDFSINNAPSGTYTTIVDSVNGRPLENAETPTNVFQKQ